MQHLDTSQMSKAELFALGSEDERKRFLKKLTEDQAQKLFFDWRVWARPKQIAPPGDWATWVIRAGRGFGKTRAGAGWVQERALACSKRWIAIVARTPADARDFMVEGPGGLLRNTPPESRPHYEPSKRRLTWPNGSWATIYSDEEPDQLRGYSGDTAWLDEFAKFKNPRESWDNLEFGMRETSNDRPRRLITTTPKPLQILTEIERLPSTVRVIGSSYENMANLDPAWFQDTIKRYEGTRLGRQEINAEILDDLPGALWTRDLLERQRRPSTPQLRRVVVGVDPSGSGGEDSGGSSIGIVAVGLAVDGCCYVLADNTCHLSPDGWGRRAVETATRWDADRIVAERNFGGAMVEHVIRTVDKNASLRLVSASRGKVARAEPVAALYEQKKVWHVGGFPDLEDQMCSFTSEGYLGESSPDRADALVWAITDLMLTKKLNYLMPGMGPKVFVGGRETV